MTDWGYGRISSGHGSSGGNWERLCKRRSVHQGVENVIKDSVPGSATVWLGVVGPFRRNVEDCGRGTHWVFAPNHEEEVVT